MKIGIFSDLHLEFAPWRYEFKTDVDLYINAGDTHPDPYVRERLSSYFDVPYFEVRGNHDFYGSTFPNFGDTFNSYWIGNVGIAGATLWTPASPIEFLDYKRDMMDFSQIKGITEDKYNRAHSTDLAYIKDCKPDIVVTHHSPSMRSCSSKYRYSHMNKFFHNKLDELIEDLQPKLWVHGHTHDRHDYKIGQTRVICHPRGYPGENNKDYKPKYVEV